METKTLEQRKRVNLAIHIILSLAATLTIGYTDLSIGYVALFVTIIFGLLFLHINQLYKSEAKQ